MTKHKILKTNNFRVLIVDDKQSVLNAAKDWIEHKIIVGGEEFIVELITVNIEVIGLENEYRISEQTLNSLNAICNIPFDLIFIDFGFVKQGLITDEEVIRIHQENPQKTKREIIDEIVLNPSHIVNEAINIEEYSKTIKKNFINYNSNLYVYTYIPSKLERDYTCADVRGNVTNKYFPKAKIKIIDTRKELFNNSMFENKHDSEFYPFLISKFISKIINIEISEYLLRNNSELKRKLWKIKKSNRIMSISIILPSIIAGILLPTIFNFFEQKNYLSAIAFIITLIIIILIFTIGQKFLEKQQEKWLK